ncbi:MAG: hypothetical protein GX085_04470 [Firmicutes bacterium]|nr:hypothetical protein [Bacillota bacterium]
MPSGSRERFFSRLFPGEEWRRGREYGREGLISGACYGEGVWQGTVTGALGRYRVRVKRESGGWRMNCSCPSRQGRCRHAAALLYYWLREPEAFAPMAEVRRQLESLSRSEAVELLQLVAGEEGELLRRLLAGRKEREEKHRLPLEKLLRLVRNLGLETRSPWRSRQVWEERWYNLLLVVEEELRTEAGGKQKKAWEALLLLTEKLLDFITGFSLETVAAGYLLRLLEPLSTYAEEGIPRPVAAKIFGFYLRTPLTAGEEERFRAFLCRLAVVEGREAFSSLAWVEALHCEKEDQLPVVRWVHLAGELWPPGSEGFPVLARWCLEDYRRLLPLLDFLEEKEEYREAKTLLQAGADLFAGAGGRYLYRLRLAALHRALGEEKEALYLENLNFTERPGREEYFRLQRLAVKIGEWPRIKPGVFRALAGKAPALYRELQAMEAGNFPGPP